MKDEECQRCSGAGCIACDAQKSMENIKLSEINPMDSIAPKEDIKLSEDISMAHAEPITKIKDPKKVSIGKKNRAAGRTFETKAREDLIKGGWIVSKWQNNVEFALKKEQFEESIISSKKEKVVHAKNKFLGPGKPMMLGAGFPDFVAFRRTIQGSTQYNSGYDVIGVEVKTNGKLSKLEKAKCKFLLQHKIFNRILIASKTKAGRKIVVKYQELNLQNL